MTNAPGETLARLVKDVQALRDKGLERLELQEEVGVPVPEEVKREAEIMASRHFGETPPETCKNGERSGGDVV